MTATTDVLIVILIVLGVIALPFFVSHKPPYK